MATDPLPTVSSTQESKSSTQESKWVVRGSIFFVVVVLCVIGYGLFQSEGRFLLQLQETAVSRGLITFLVAIITVSIALVIAVWVVASNGEPEALKVRFSYAKDILATLVGILGTILGFYFGSAEKSTVDTLVLADIQFRAGQAITHASGGTAPYRYTIVTSDAESKATRVSKVSKDGWIFESLPGAVKGGTPVTVEVTDSRDRKASRTTGYQLEERESPQVPSNTSQPPTPGVTPGASPPQAPASPASR